MNEETPGLDEVIAAYHRAEEAGDPTTREQWLERYPQLADYFAGLDAIAAAFPTGVPTGEVIGDYQVIRELGRGGMGVVFEARHRVLGRRVALKMMLGGMAAGDVQRLRREAEVTALLDHPNIVPVYEVGEHARQPFFTMKLVEGSSLDAELARFVVDPKAAARLMATVAHAVHHAHSRGVLHRDLKPSNVLLGPDGQPYVTDFGLARLQGAVALTQPGALVGTPSYMAPEQIGPGASGTTASDVHALGAMLYALLTGKPPFEGADVIDTLLRVTGHTADPPSRHNRRVPADLDRICLKCLEKDPARRYTSAAELARDLERYLNGQPVLARPAGLLERAWRWARRAPAQAATAVLFLALAALLALAVRAYNDARAHQAEAAVALARSSDEKFRLVGHAVRLTAGRVELRALMRRPEGPQRRASLQAFLDATRGGFNQWFTWAADEPLVNWFVVDPSGVLVADSDRSSRAVDINWRRRDYARLLDADRGDGPDVAAVFHSQQDGWYKFAVTARILDGPNTLGVLGASVPVAPKMLGLDLTDHPPSAAVVGPTDWSYGAAPVGRPRWAVALGRDAGPGRAPAWITGPQAAMLDRFLAEPGLRQASCWDGGDAVDAVRIGETRYIALFRHPLPWPAVWILWLAVPLVAAGGWLLLRRPRAQEKVT